MIDPKHLRKDIEETEKKLQTKVPETSLRHAQELDTLLRNKKTEVELLKAARNEASASIGRMKQSGQDTTTLMSEVANQGDAIKLLDADISHLESQLQDILARIPNIPMDDVPVGLDPAENVLLRSHGQKTQFPFPFKNHVELNEKLGLFDFPRGAKITGSGWPLYRGIGARLEWALINYMIHYHVQNGFQQWIPPLVVREQALFAAGQLPKFANQQYRVEGEDSHLYMIPTAEVSLNAIYMDEIIPAEALPLKYIAYTPCFRKEAGGLGAQERGLIRMHQFNKVEMFAFSTPEESTAIFEEMVFHAESILKNLEIHYRSMLLVTGDMSFSGAKTIDIEAWLPGQNRYYEVSSVSNCTDYQSRRSQTRYRKKNEKPQLVHTLNGSGLATSRLLVAILENNQNADGSVTIPKVLQPYLDGKERIEPVANTDWNF
ncbi:MAG: serine--tRNA ligase [Chlamydia sp.]